MLRMSVRRTNHELLIDRKGLVNERINGGSSVRTPIVDEMTSIAFGLSTVTPARGVTRLDTNTG